MLALAIATALQSPASFDFKGIALGSTTAQFRAQPTTPGQYGSRRIFCTGDPGAESWLTPPRQEAEVGVTRCGVAEQIGGWWSPADVRLTPEFSASARYSFFHDRLYQISVHPDIEAQRTVEEALVARFGPPSRSETGTFQTEAGAVFPQRTLTWTRGAQTVTMIAPALSTRKMMVLYLDTDASRQVEAAERAMHNPADAM